MGEEQIRYEKSLKEYDYQELESLKWRIKDLPTFILSENQQNKWFTKLTNMQIKILDKVEKDHSSYSRKEKVERYIKYLNSKDTYQKRYYINDGKVWDNYLDRFPCEGTIDYYYLKNRFDIEVFIDKLMRVAPLTKEQLEQLVLNEEKIYFGD